MFLYVLCKSRKKSYRPSSFYEHNHTAIKWCQQFPHLFSGTASLYCIVLSPLEEELRKLREEMNIETLKQELEKERLKRLDLEQKMNEILKTRYEKTIGFFCLRFQTIQSLIFNNCIFY